MSSFEGISGFPLAESEDCLLDGKSDEKGHGRRIPSFRLSDFRDGAEVFLCHIDQRGTFYLQLAAWANKFNDFSLHLNSTLTVDASEVMEVELGQFYALQSFVDSVWYRVRALDAYPSRVFSIDFIDFGNRELVSGSRLRRLPEAFIHLPIQAVPCRLKGVDEAFPGVAQFRFVRAARRFVNQKFICRTSPGKAGDEFFYVELFSAGRSLMDLLKPPATAMEADSNYPSVSPYVHQALTRDRRYRIWIPEFFSEVDFWVQFAQDALALEILMDELQLSRTETLGNWPPPPKQRLLVRSSLDGKLYRGVATNVVSEGSASVTSSIVPAASPTSSSSRAEILLVDYGRREWMTADRVFRFDVSDLSSFDALSFNAALFRNDDDKSVVAGVARSSLYDAAAATTTFSSSASSSPAAITSEMLMRRDDLVGTYKGRNEAGQFLFDIDVDEGETSSRSFTRTKPSMATPDRAVATAAEVPPVTPPPLPYPVVDGSCDSPALPTAPRLSPADGFCPSAPTPRAPVSVDVAAAEVDDSSANDNDDTSTVRAPLQSDDDVESVLLTQLLSLSPPRESATGPSKASVQLLPPPPDFLNSSSTLKIHPGSSSDPEPMEAPSLSLPRDLVSPPPPPLPCLTDVTSHPNFSILPPCATWNLLVSKADGNRRWGRVVVAHIDREGAFLHLQCVENAADFGDLTDGMQQLYGESEREELLKADGIKAGDLVAAKFSEDHEWYRAVVLDVECVTNKVRLKFCDYGNWEETSIVNVRRLRPRFVQYPAQAHKALLNPDVIDVNDSLRSVNEASVDEEFWCRVATVSGSGRVFVDLIGLSSVVAEEAPSLLEDQASPASEVTPLSAATPGGNVGIDLSTSAEMAGTLDDSFEVIRDPRRESPLAEKEVSVLKSSNLESLVVETGMMVSPANESPSPLNVAPRPIDVPSLERNEDGCAGTDTVLAATLTKDLARSKADVSGAATTHVGDEEGRKDDTSSLSGSASTSSSTIRLPQKMKETPRLCDSNRRNARRQAASGRESSSPLLSPSRTGNSSFPSISPAPSNAASAVRTVSSTSSTPSVALSSNPPRAPSPPILPPTSAPPPASAPLSSLHTTGTTIPPPVVPALANLLPAYLPTIESVSKFYLQLKSAESGLVQLSQRVAEAAKKAGPMVPADLIFGTPCLADYDGEWYRGVVVEDCGVDRNNNNATNMDSINRVDGKMNGLLQPASHVAIFFPDYGNTEPRVPISGGRIKRIPPHLISLPALAIEASLVGILNKNRDVLDAKFAEILEEDPAVEVTFISRGGVSNMGCPSRRNLFDGPHFVELVVNGRDVSRLLDMELLKDRLSGETEVTDNQVLIEGHEQEIPQSRPTSAISSPVDLRASTGGGGTRKIERTKSWITDTSSSYRDAESSEGHDMITLPRKLMDGTGHISVRPPAEVPGGEAVPMEEDGENWDLGDDAGASAHDEPASTATDNAFLIYTRKCLEAIARDPLLSRLPSVRRKFTSAAASSSASSSPRQ